MEEKHMLHGKTEKRVRKPTTSRFILDKFPILAEGNDDQRIKETKNLLATLQKRQQVHATAITKEAPLCSDIDYALNRLIRGLASNRKWARVGFSTALSQLLSVVLEIEVKDVISRINSMLVYSKQESKGEKGNIMFGKVTGLIAIIRSGRLHPSLTEEIRSVVAGLCQLESLKSYLGCPCAYGLEQLLLSVDKVTFTAAILPGMMAKLTCGWAEADPNSLLVLLTCVCRGFLGKKFLRESWGTPSVVHSDNWEKLATVIKASSTVPCDLHRVNVRILEEVQKSDLSLVEFWEKALVRLMKPAKKNLMSLGLFYLKAVTQTLRSGVQIKQVYTPLVTECLHRNQKRVSQSAVALSEELAKACAECDSDSQVDIIRHFLSMNMILRDSTFLRKLIHQLPPDGMETFSRDLMRIVRGERIREDVEFGGDAVREWALREIKLMILTAATGAGSELVQRVLEFILLHAFFTARQHDTPNLHQTDVCDALPAPMSDHIWTALQDTFFAVINSLQQPAKDRDLQSTLHILYRVARYAESLLSQTSVSLIKGSGEQISDELSSALDMVEKLQSKRSASPENQAFRLIFIHLGLQLLVEPTQAADILKDVHVCYEKSQKKLKKSEKKSEEVEWMDVMTELLISMMSQPSRLTRCVARTAFRLLSPHVTTTSLHLIINVLGPGEEDEGEEGPITFEDKVESDDEDSSPQRQQMVENSDPGDSGHESGSDSETDQSEAEVDETLRQTVKAALGTAAAESDKEEESEAEMGDEEMFRLDDALSEAFRSMQSSKSRVKRNRKQLLLTFKLRTLDLVETFVRTHPPAGLVVYLVTPVLDLMDAGQRNKDESALGKRANLVFNCIIKLKKSQADASVDKDDILKKMEDLIHYSTKVSSLHMVKEVSQAFLFMMRVVLNLDPPTQRSPVKTRSHKSEDVKPRQPSMEKDEFLVKVLDLLKKYLSDYLNKRDCRLNHLFFHNIISRFWNVTWPLSDVLLKCIGTDSVRVFLRTQACSLLTLLLKPDMPTRIGAEVWEEFSEEFSNTIYRVFSEVNESDVKPKHTHELLVLLLRFLSLGGELTKVPVERLGEKLGALQHKLLHNTRLLCNKVIRLCSTPAPSHSHHGKKRMNSEGAELPPSSPSKSPRLSADPDPLYVSNNTDMTVIKSEKPEAKMATSDAGSRHGRTGEKTSKKRRKSINGTESCSKHDTKDQTTSVKKKRKRKTIS